MDNVNYVVMYNDETGKNDTLEIDQSLINYTESINNDGITLENSPKCDHIPEYLFIPVIIGFLIVIHILNLLFNRISKLWKKI